MTIVKPEQIPSRIAEPDLGLRRFWKETKFRISGKCLDAHERTADRTNSEKREIVRIMSWQKLFDALNQYQEKLNGLFVHKT